MHTHFIGAEEVDAYLREFVGRILKLGEKMPTLWCPIGRSGSVLLERLLRVGGQPLADRVHVLSVSFERDENKVVFSDGDPKADIKGRRVLVLDSSIHSGATMYRVVQEIDACSAEGVCSYSLVVKNGSNFVPSFWAVLIEDHDRAYFLLDELPTQRLNRHDPYLHLRRLAHKDLNSPPVKSGLRSLDRITWSDRYYDMVNSAGQMTYLLEVGSRIVGYLTCQSKDERTLCIQEVAVDSALAGHHLGGALMRWGETVARCTQCEDIELWAIATQVDFYKRQGFEHMPKPPMELAEGESYLLMRKRIVYTGGGNGLRADC
ncbi:MAG: GNAT family N-acetyltransferase [Polyangia bacterium]|jgi:N-acetylglutamate synthase-like GNAT family acetyltransferase/hypoxanthine-guanine phosphoribosyltransferase